MGQFIARAVSDQILSKTYIEGYKGKVDCEYARYVVLGLHQNSLAWWNKEFYSFTLLIISSNLLALANRRFVAVGGELLAWYYHIRNISLPSETEWLIWRVWSFWLTGITCSYTDLIILNIDHVKYEHPTINNNEHNFCWKDQGTS